MTMLLRILKENGDEDYIQFINNNSVAMDRDKNIEFEVLKGILKQEDVAALRHFVESGFDLDVRTYDNSTVLHTTQKISIPFLEEMIDLGANIFALNLFGETPMLKLFRKKRNTELQDFYLSKGVNPYLTNFRNQNALQFVRTINSIEERISRYNYLRENFQEARTYAQLIKDRDFEQALFVVTNDIQNVGGMDTVLKKIDNPNMYGLMLNLQGAYTRMNMTSEANQVLKVIMSLSHIPAPSMQRLNYFSVIPAMLEGDEETLFKQLDYLVELNRSYKEQKDMFVIYGYFLSHILENEEQMEHFNYLFKRSLPKNTYAKLLKQMVYSNVPSKISHASEEVERRVNVYINSKKTELLLLLGCYYLMKKDYDMAELMFRRILEYVNTIPVTLLEHSHCAFLLLEYIERNR